MFERTNSQSGTDGFRKMLFGTNGRRMPVVPAMEQSAPRATEIAAEMPCLAACSLAMVYSPPQEWRAIYPVGEAIDKGTLFSELDKPFLGKTPLNR